MDRTVPVGAALDCAPVTEKEFMLLLESPPEGATHIANGYEATDAEGKPVWAITDEHILDATGRVIASLLQSPPLFVGIGCPWRSGLLGERISADHRYS